MLNLGLDLTLIKYQIEAKKKKKLQEECQPLKQIIYLICILVSLMKPGF